MPTSATQTLPESLTNLPPKLAYLRILQEIKRRQDRNKLSTYKPYPKQIDFHNRGATHRERLFRAGNQLGKTWSSAYEIAFHLTGLYPDWWQGKRWARGVTGWALGESMESTRDTLQRLVLGRPGELGTGTIPEKLIMEVKRAQGIADSVDAVFVKHASGLVSRLYFKSYEKGRSKLQGETLDFAALDEEPPLDIYTEVLTRTNATKGIVWITFTPLLGMSEVVRLFLQNATPDRSDTSMTIDDVLHYTAEERARIIASYPAHEREARAKGIPILGSGRVFPIAESAITVEPFQIPDHWPVICGIDFGWDHPTAMVWVAWDRDADTLYVYDCHRSRETTPTQHAPFILSRGSWIPVAWPHDGLQHEKGSGFQLAEQYRNAGINMLHEMAQFPETGDENGHKVSRVSVEAGVLNMLQRMQAGKLKVFSSLNEWFEEFRLYHRKDGKIVKLQDDLMAATRYAYMMMRYAITPPDPQKMVADPRRNYNWRIG
ncbi:Terminase-like family [uncultured Caudovirales phage]|uniref:Terminase, large subunit n=1 Tax=uncultured Caudovirales phage TaxID=2100421 RepID=A0A6J5N857_9CAUD|nr:Terminase-like family [uncultured Caudovirales phage]